MSGVGCTCGVARQALQQRRFLGGVGQRHVDDVDRAQGGAACVEAALVHLQRRNGAGRDAQRLRRQRAQGIQRVGRRRTVGVGLGGRIGGPAHFDRQRLQRQFQFGDTDHVGSSGPVVIGQRCR
jgi:hypothetical protein